MKARAKHVWAKSPITMIVCRARERKKPLFSYYEPQARCFCVFELFAPNKPPRADN